MTMRQSDGNRNGGDSQSSARGQQRTRNAEDRAPARAARGSHSARSSRGSHASPASHADRRSNGRTTPRRQRQDAGYTHGPMDQPERLIEKDDFAPKSGGRRLSRRQREQLDHFRSLTATLFVGVLAVGFLVGSLFFVRPATSDLERRTLTAFPAITFDSLMDGAFFNDVSLWYADTYPLREALVSANLSLQRLYGVQSETRMVGNVAQEADEIPVDQDAVEEKAPRREVDPPTERQMADDVQDKIMSSLYLENGAAYSIYYFSKESVDAYAAALNTCAEELKGEARVFSIIVPNNSAGKLDEQTLKDLGGSDQKQAIAYLDSKLDPDISCVDIYDTMRDHRDEYTYFRTDHHWTQLGAYYAYEKFCEEAGVKPASREGRQTIVFDGFLGTYYDQTHDPTMEIAPDTLEALMPTGKNEMTYWTEDGEEVQVEIIKDVSDWNNNSFYMTFIAGDQPLSYAHNDKITDGSSCVLIKDSYGCAFAPLLMDSYEDVYIIDFRYSDLNIPDFVRDNKIQDVIFLNNLSIAGTLPVADKLQSMM